MNKEKIVIHITDANQCNRKLYFDYIGKKQLPVHYYTLRGIMNHLLISKFLNSNSKDLTYKEVLENRRDRNEVILKKHFNAVLPEVKDILNRFIKWYNKTETFDKNNFYSEKELKLDWESVIICGKPDLYTSKVLIDFKPGKRGYRTKKEYLEQLSGYKWLLKETQNINIEKSYIIYLGEEEVLEEEIELKKKYLYDLKTKLREKIKLKKQFGKGIIPEPERSVKCSWCIYNSSCRGY